MTTTFPNNFPNILINIFTKIFTEVADENRVPLIERAGQRVFIIAICFLLWILILGDFLPFLFPKWLNFIVLTTLMYVVVRGIWVLIHPRYKFIHPASPEAVALMQRDLERDFYSDGIFQYHHNGFSVHANDREIGIKWDEIDAILAYKTHIYSNNVWLSVICSDTTKNFHLHEEINGWFSFVKEIKEKMPAFGDSWEQQKDRVQVQPTILYLKNHLIREHILDVFAAQM